MGVGGALVSGAKWTSPVVVSVSLPAHAQTTTLCLDNEPSCNIRFRYTNFDPFEVTYFVDITATSQCNADFSGVQVRVIGIVDDGVNPPIPIDITASLDASGKATNITVVTVLATFLFFADFTVSFVDQATYGSATGACMVNAGNLQKNIRY